MKGGQLAVTGPHTVVLKVAQLAVSRLHAVAITSLSMLRQAGHLMCALGSSKHTQSAGLHACPADAAAAMLALSVRCKAACPSLPVRQTEVISQSSPLHARPCNRLSLPCCSHLHVEEDLRGREQRCSYLCLRRTVIELVFAEPKVTHLDEGQRAAVHHKHLPMPASSSWEHQMRMQCKPEKCSCTICSHRACCGCTHAVEWDSRFVRRCAWILLRLLLR